MVTERANGSLTVLNRHEESFLCGLLAEHIVGQELLCHRGSLLHKPCFWVRERSQSSAEVDFVVQHQGRVIPVEIKAWSTGRMRSLHLFVEAADPGFAVRLYAGPFGRQNCRSPGGRPYELLSMPDYLAPSLSEFLDWLTKPGP